VTSTGDLSLQARFFEAPVFVADARAPRLLAGMAPAGRMRLAGLSQAGDMAVLRYVPGY
jgi:hypothetical protein